MAFFDVDEVKLRNLYKRAWVEANHGFVNPRKYPYLNHALIQYARENHCSYDQALRIAKSIGSSSNQRNRSAYSSSEYSSGRNSSNSSSLSDKEDSIFFMKCFLVVVVIMISLYLIISVSRTFIANRSMKLAHQQACAEVLQNAENMGLKNVSFEESLMRRGDDWEFHFYEMTCSNLDECLPDKLDYNHFTKQIKTKVTHGKKECKIYIKKIKCGSDSYYSFEGTIYKNGKKIN